MEDGCTWPLEDESPVVIVMMIPYLHPSNNDASDVSVQSSYQGVRGTGNAAIGIRRIVACGLEGSPTGR